MPYKELFLKNALKDNIYTYNKYFKPIKSIKKIKDIKTFEDSKNIKNLINIFSYNPSTLYDDENNLFEDDNTNLEDGQLINTSNLNDRKFFLFYFFQQCPSPDDERYKFIKKISSKNYKHGLERSRCFEFEILARDQNNVYAIEDTIDYYNANREIIEKYYHTPKKFKFFESTKITNISDLDKFRDEDTFICSTFKYKLKNLRLIEYKYFKEQEKFQHWAINPTIYEIMNEILYKENEKYKYKITNLSNDIQQLDQYKYTADNKQKIINSWNCKNQLINEYTYLSTIVNLTEYSNHKFPIVGNYTAKFSNDSQKNEVVYSYHYPRCREYPKLTMTIDLNRDRQQVKDLLNETIDLIFKKFASKKKKDDERKISIDNNGFEYEEPYSLYSLEMSIKGNISLEEKFFVYDYITYRKEQKNKYLLNKYTLYELEELEIFKQFSENIRKHYYKIKQYRNDNEAKKYIINKIRKNEKKPIITLSELDTNDFNKLSFSEIEKLNLLDIDMFSYSKKNNYNNFKVNKDIEIKKYVIEEIKKAQEKQKTNLDRLNTINLDAITLSEIKEEKLLDLLDKDEKDHINKYLNDEKDIEIREYVIEKIKKAQEKQKTNLDRLNTINLDDLTLSEIKESNLFDLLTKNEKDYININLESDKNAEIKKYVIAEIKKAEKKLKNIIDVLNKKELDNLELSKIKELKLLDILDKDEKNHYYDMELNRDNEIKKYIIEEIKEIEKDQISSIYKELLEFKLSIGKSNKNNELTSIRSIKNYYNEIKKLIEYSKLYNDFLSKE